MTLTLALSILGGLVIAGLLVQWVWTSRRSLRPPPDGRESPSRIADAERREPGLDDGTLDGRLDDEPAIGDTTLAGMVGEFGAVSTFDDAVAAPPRTLRKRIVQRIDGLIDAIATLSVDHPVPGDAVVPHLPPTRRAGTKPFLIEGLNAETAEWEAPVSGHRYTEFQAGVQLANRMGALNEIEYSEFVQKVQRFADGIGATGDFPDMLDVAARAKELDQFASQHDAQLAVHLRARGAAWSVGYLQQHAARHGFVPGVVPGRLVLPSPDEGAPPVLTLTFDQQIALSDDPGQAALRSAQLSFDVPQTDAGEQPFDAWRRSAEALATSLEADVVDDRGVPIAAAAFESIGKDLQQLYRALADRDLAAGTAAARRLFD